MLATLTTAGDHGDGVGAHGYRDLAKFGRRYLDASTGDGSLVARAVCMATEGTVEAIDAG